MISRSAAFAALLAAAMLGAAAAAAPPPPTLSVEGTPPPSAPPPASDLQPPPASGQPPAGPPPPLPFLEPLSPPPPLAPQSPLPPPGQSPLPPPLPPPAGLPPPPIRSVSTPRPTPRPSTKPTPKPHAKPHLKPHPRPHPRPHPKPHKPTKPAAELLQIASTKYRVKGPGTKLRNGGVIGQVPITFTDASNRGATYYLPPGYYNHARPMMVAFHGLDGAGIDMVHTFMDQANKHGFIILGIDSHKLYNWHAAYAGTPATDDFYHTMGCMNWLERQPGVKVNKKLVTTAGISMGGAIAAALATRYTVFRTGMVLHSPVKVQQIGTQRTPLWISTGTRDPDAPPSAIAKFIKLVTKYVHTLPKIKYEVYRTGHCATCVPAELEDAVDWWLSHPR